MKYTVCGNWLHIIMLMITTALIRMLTAEESKVDNLEKYCCQEKVKELANRRYQLEAEYEKRKRKGKKMVEIKEKMRKIRRRINITYSKEMCQAIKKLCFTLLTDKDTPNVRNT